MMAMPATDKNGKNTSLLGSESPFTSHTGSTRGRRWRHILNIVSSFLFGQGALQGVNVAIGLFLVRALSLRHYAQFGLAFGFQATASMLMDLGYASTIIPLVGERFNDRALVGSYLRAAKHLRDKAFWILGPFAAITFLAMMNRHHWGWITETVLLSSVLLSLYSSGPVVLFGTADSQSPIAGILPAPNPHKPRTASYICRFGNRERTERLYGGWTERAQCPDKCNPSGPKRSTLCRMAQNEPAKCESRGLGLYPSRISNLHFRCLPVANCSLSYQRLRSDGKCCRSSGPEQACSTLRGPDDL